MTTLTPALAAVVDAYSRGATGPSSVATMLGISLSAARQRVMRCREQGLIPRPSTSPRRDAEREALVAALRPPGSGSPVLRTTTMRGLLAGGWTEPVLVVRHGEVAGTFVPSGASWRTTGGPNLAPYVPDTWPIELAKVAAEAATGLAEIEELNDLAHPGRRVVASNRQRDAMARKRRYLALKEAHR